MAENRQVFLFSNRCRSSVRFNDYHFLEKTKGLRVCPFRCSTVGCYASISLKIDRATNEIQEPYLVSHLNENHKNGCNMKPEGFFETREFMVDVRKVLVDQTNMPVQQVYETQRKIHHAESALESAQQIIIDKTFTSNNKDPFLIYDNKRVNRIIGFGSPTGLRMLSESKAHHGDGTFHTKSKYFGQLYVIHAFFRPFVYDSSKDRVWVKRMIPCAWFFMKRRRTKNYVEVLESLVVAGVSHNLVICPTTVMIDFEKSTKKGIVVKGCIFLFGIIFYVFFIIIFIISELKYKLIEYKFSMFFWD
jgi:hypothetical protein